MQEIVDYLKKEQKTISTMESLTGGFLASQITNVSGASLVFQFGAVTYSNSFKIKIGVPSDVIEKYSVYSMECAKAMSQAICKYANASYGVGLTGKFNEVDPNNLVGDDSTIYLSLYDRDNDQYYTQLIKAKDQARELNKKMVSEEFISLFTSKIIKKNQ